MDEKIRYVEIYVPLDDNDFEERKRQIVKLLELKYLHNDLYVKNCPLRAREAELNEAKKGRTLVILYDDSGEFDVCSSDIIHIIEE